MDKFVTRVQSADDTLLDERLQAALTTIFGFPLFRPYQKQIVTDVMKNHDVFVVMPTGGGKSLCYALPAVLTKGVTVVISPLISLIEDQVGGFLRMPSGGIPSAYWTSNCNAKQVQAVKSDLDRASRGNEPFMKLLYLTPERIVNAGDTKAALQKLYQQNMLARFIIDEAHCVSTWGHDFRKDYVLLGNLRDDYPETPIVALTATARQKVAEDTIRILRMNKCVRFSTGYDRPNLFFEVRPKKDKTGILS